MVSHGEYGVPEGLQFGFPVRVDASGSWQVVQGIDHGEFARQRIAATTEELLAEKADVADLLGG